jgi:hypothetical protein
VFVNPLWWYAMPCGIVNFNVAQTPNDSFSNVSNKSFRFLRNTSDTSSLVTCVASESAVFSHDFFDEQKTKQECGWFSSTRCVVIASKSWGAFRTWRKCLSPRLPDLTSNWQHVSDNITNSRKCTGRVVPEIFTN